MSILSPVSLIQENRAKNVAEVRARHVWLESKPIQVNLELTGVCNIQPPCVFCTGKNVGYNYRPLNVSYLNKYSDFLERCERVNEDSFGEPLTHRSFVDVARRFINAGQTFSFVTNGLCLSGEVAQGLAELGPSVRFHISFNAACDRTFFHLTGRRFEVLLTNVRNYIALYRELHGTVPDITLTFIVMRINADEVADFIRLAHDLEVKALLASLHERPSIPLGQFGYDFVYEDERLSDAEYAAVGSEARELAAELNTIVLIQWDAATDSAIRGFAEEGVDIPCLIPWRFLFVQEHSQNVYACPYHRRPIANLAGQSLSDVWNGKELVNLRASLAAGKIPKYCWDNAAGCPLVMRERQLQRHDLKSEIRVGENDHEQFGAGWHPLEPLDRPTRWTARTAEFQLRPNGGQTLCLTCNSYKPNLAEDPTTGRIEIGQETVGTFEVNRTEWVTLSFPMPAHLTSDPTADKVEGRIVIDNPWRPHLELKSSFQEAVIGQGTTVQGSRDPRLLGVAVSELWLE